MRTSYQILCICIGLLVSVTSQVTAQNANPGDPVYLTVDYMKVKPEMRADYISLEKIWKKIHQAKIKEGKIKGWSLFRIDYPSGANTDYNFVTYANLGKNTSAANSMDSEYFPKNWESLLTEDELAMVSRTGEIRTIVKSEVWQLRDGVYDDQWQEAKIQVCNFFALKEGKTGKDQYDIEKKYWMPIMEERIKDGKLEGWDISNLYLPFGADQPYEVSTVDVYKNMTQYMKDRDMAGYAKKLHPGRTFAEIVEDSAEVSKLIKGEVRTLLDRTD